MNPALNHFTFIRTSISFCEIKVGDRAIKEIRFTEMGIKYIPGQRFTCVEFPDGEISNLTLEVSQLPRLFHKRNLSSITCFV